MVPLRRNYDAAYLADIGQSGTNGILVTRHNALLAKCLLRAEFALPAATHSSTLPCCGSWDDYEQSHLVTTTHSFTLSPPAASATFGSIGSSGTRTRYAFGDCTSPTGFGSLGSRGVEAEATDLSSEFTDGEYGFKSLATFWLRFNGIRSPWWGRMATDPGNGYDAPEGHWAVSFDATLRTDTWRRILPDDDYEWGAEHIIAEIYASASGWFYSEDPFHRIRGAARPFSLGDCSFSTDSYASHYYADTSFEAYLSGAEQDVKDALEDILGNTTPTLRVVAAVPFARRSPS